jgi:hypothetical protein
LTVGASAVTGVSPKGTDASSTAVTLSYASNGTINGLSVTTSNGTIDWSTSDGDAIDSSGGVVTAVSAGGNQTAAFNDPNNSSSGWNYQTYGVWTDIVSSATFNVGLVSTGLPTAGSSIPTTGTANFLGQTEGFYVDAGGNLYSTQADVNVAANFTGRSLAFTSSNSQKMDLSDVVTSASNLNMNGTLTYSAGNNEFTGTVTATGLTGTNTGRFYGPHAEELGGVFSLTGSGVQYYSGAYGAAQ